MKSERRAPKAVVIGAGIAGLASAHHLRKQGIDVEVLEREPVVGGAVRSILKEERYLLELGPNAFLASADPLQRLARELSIEPLIVGGDQISRNRYIFRRGRMHPLPTGPGSFLKSGLLSASGKVRLLAEPFVKSQSRDAETLAAFTIRRAGKEVLSALVDPLVSGVWAGDPAELEVQSLIPKLVEIEQESGSVLKGMRKLAGGKVGRGLFSFRWGMGTLTARIEEELGGKIRKGIEAEGLQAIPGDRRWRIQLSGWHAAVEADAVVLATPAHSAAKLLLPLDAKIFSALSAIPYASLAVVHTAFREGDLPRRPDGFGVLVPRHEGVRMLGSIWSSAIFPRRCPGNEVLLTNFIGGATDPAAADLSDDELVAEVREGLKTTMGIEARPLFTFLKRWGQAIPQYTVGHRGRLETVVDGLTRLPGIFLTGSYLAGVSVSDTAAHARREVDRITEYLRRPVVSVSR